MWLIQPPPVVEGLRSRCRSRGGASGWNLTVVPALNHLDWLHHSFLPRRLRLFQSAHQPVFSGPLCIRPGHGNRQCCPEHPGGVLGWPSHASRGGLSGGPGLAGQRPEHGASRCRAGPELPASRSRPQPQRDPEGPGPVQRAGTSFRLGKHGFFYFFWFSFADWPSSCTACSKRRAPVRCLRFLRCSCASTPLPPAERGDDLLFSVSRTT